MAHKILTRQEAHDIGGKGEVTEPNRGCTIETAELYGCTSILGEDENKNRLIWSAEKAQNDVIEELVYTYPEYYYFKSNVSNFFTVFVVPEGYQPDSLGNFCWYWADGNIWRPNKERWPNGWSVNMANANIPFLFNSYVDMSEHQDYLFTTNLVWYITSSDGFFFSVPKDVVTPVATDELLSMTARYVRNSETTIPEGEFRIYDNDDGVSKTFYVGQVYEGGEWFAKNNDSIIVTIEYNILGKFTITLQDVNYENSYDIGQLNEYYRQLQQQR